MLVFDHESAVFVGEGAGAAESGLLCHPPGGQVIGGYVGLKPGDPDGIAIAKATFAERVPGRPPGRPRTCGLDGVLQAVAMALGGRAGARLAGRLARSASRARKFVKAARRYSTIQI